MMARTHMVIGFFVGLLIFPLLNSNPLVFFPLVVFGSLLPDVDHNSLDSDFFFSSRFLS